VEEMTQQTMFGPKLKQWVSIRDALGLEAKVIGIASNPYTKDENGEWDKSSRTYKEISDEPSTGITAKGPLWNQGPFVVSGPGSEPWRLDGPSHAVMTTEVKGTRGAHIKGRPDRASDTAWLAAGRRRLTWQECAVLQGFPGDYPFQGRTQASIYKQVGNAVCPKVSEALARCVMKAMDI
jgi:site-specific DNA-cytosine methylase